MNNFRNGAFTVLCQFPRTKFCAARKVSPNWLQETMTCHSSHCFSIVWLGWCVICHQTELGRTELRSDFSERLFIRGRPFNSWGEGWVISGHQEFFFLAIWWAGYFFLFFSHKLSITFVLHAIFFFRQALAGNFFSKSPTPSLKS